MKQGRILHTRDGRRMGNAIIVKIEQHDELGPIAHIKTDFGNTARMTRGELDEFFRFGEFQCVTTWMEKRANA